MLVVMQPTATAAEIERVCEEIVRQGFKPLPMPGETRTAIGLLGDDSRVDWSHIEGLPAVASVLIVQKPYRQAAREWRIRALAGSAGASALSYQLAHIGVAFDRVRIEGEVAYVALDRDEDAADVLARLVRAGVAITHFAPAVGDIERTYLSLAGGAR